MRQGTFHRLPSTFCAASRRSVKFQCGLETFRQLPSTFCAVGRTSLYFLQHSVRLGDLLSTSINFPCRQKIFQQIPSIFHVVRKLSFNIFVVRRPSVNLRQHSLWCEDLLCNSVNFTYGRENFRRLLSNFLAHRRPSVNYHRSPGRTER